MGKRLLSMLLAMLMVIGMFPMQVLATELGTPAGDILSPVTEVEANSDPDAEENIEEEPILDSPALEPIEEGSLEENEEINAVEPATEGEEATVWDGATIATVADLQAFAAAVNAGDKFAGKTVKLTADIDLAGIQWQPIGGSTVYFAGEFDGNGKTISNLTNTEDVARKGLFGLVEDCYIHDLTLKDVKFSGTAESMRVGALAGNLNNPNWNGTGCIIKNVTVDGLDYDLNDTDGLIGGLIGYSWNSYIKNCTVKNADMNVTSTGDSCVATVIGYGRGVTDNCYVEDFPTYGSNIAAADVNADGGVVNYVDCKVEGATVNLSGTVSFGGFFGADTYNHWRNTFKNCDVTGLNVICAAGDGVYTVGGFMSAQAGGYSAEAIIGCDVAGAITNNGSNPESTFAGFIGGKWGRSGGASNCTAAVNITAAAGDVAGFCGSVVQYNDSMSYTFEGCTSSGDVKTENGTAAGFLATASGTNLNLTVEDCTVTGTVEGTTEAALIGNIESTTGEVNLNGNTVPENMTEVGGNTDLIKEPTWYEKGEADGVFTINTADELKDFAQKVKEGNTFADKKVILGADIDLAGFDWPMIGTYGKPFSGEFDGNGKTISNLTDSTANDHKGLFAHLNNAYVHDLTLKDVKFSGTCEGALYAGALVGEAESKNVIKNVDVNGITWNITSKNGSIGGLAGYSYDTNYINCDLTGVVFNVTSTSNVNIGGMVGQGRGVGEFSAAYGNTSTYSYENCTVTNMTADVTGKTTVGGFLGVDGYNHWANYGKSCTVTGLKVTCAADDAQYTVGGFMGSNNGANYGKDYAFENCTTTGEITATNNTNTASTFGGFLGYIGGRPVALGNCNADVTINVGAGDVGGFCGETAQYFAHEYKFEGCVAEGNVTTANGTAGGFIANIQHGGDGKEINVVINNSEANNTATSQSGKAEEFIGNINDNKNGTETGGEVELDQNNTVNGKPVTDDMIGGKEDIVVTYVAFIGETGYESLEAAVKAAAEGETTTITLAEGTHVFPNSGIYANKKIVFEGGEGVIIDATGLGNEVYGDEITFNNVTMNFPGTSHKGITHTNKVVFNNCTLTGTQTLYAADVDFNKCTFKVEGDAYAVWTYGASDATFTNCTFNTDGKAILVYTETAHTAEINVSGCTFNATTNRGKAAIEVGKSDSGESKYTLNITNSTADSNFVANKSTSNLWGNKNNMDGEGMTVVINNEQVYPVYTNWIQKADTSWYVEGQTEFTITTAEQLAGLAELSAEGLTFEGILITLDNDINLAGLEWTPIGTLDASKQFMGEFNGNGKTISNMTIEEDYNSTKARVGLFSGLQGINAASDTTFAKVHNLTIANANITISGSNARAGVLAGNVWSGTYVENVTISGGKINTNGSIHAGGLAGYVYTSMVSNVTVDGIEINHTGEGTAYIGGVSGNTAGHGTYWTAESSNTMFNNCDAKNVKINVNASGTVYAGGFIGACSSYNGSVNSQSECEVINLTMTLAGDANYQAGGFAGQQNGMGGDSNCTATGTITSTGTNVASSFGGFIGSIWGRGRQHTGNTVDVDITVDNGNVGGFVGNMSQHTANNHVFTNCTVNGNVETQNGTAGGFIAQYNGWDGGNDVRFELNNCAVKGEVIGTTMAGGLVGYIGFKENGTTEYVKIYKNCTLPTVINAETTHSIANIAPETDWYEDEEIYRIGLKVTIEDAGRSISLSGEIFINQYFKVEGLDAEYVKANAGILFWDKEVTNETALIGTQTYKYEEALKGTTTFSGRSKGIPAKAYADELYIRIYVQLEDETYIYSDVVEYSVQDYCELVFEAESAGEQLKYTCASLLHYGAAAQTYFKYNLSDMANAVVPESYPAKEFSADLIDGLVSANTELIGTGDVEDKGKSLSLVDAIRINYYFAPVTDANWKVQSATLYVWNGVNGELTMENAKAFEMKVTKDGTRYTAQINGISASKYSETVYARACFVDTDGNAHYSDVVGYSVEEYAKIAIGNSTNANLTDLIKKMVVYGEDARLYFTK